jgi:mono/diheme cytochrome c family protein
MNRPVYTLARDTFAADVVTSSCPALGRASTSCFPQPIKDVDGRDKPGHDEPERPRIRRSHLHVLAAAVLCLLWTAPVSAQDYSHGRRLFLEKADCQYCHGWAGDGAGGGQSPGGAANLRKSQLDRANLITVIRCGIPGTAMPHFEEEAYSDKRCYGMTEAELGSRTPPLPPSTTLPRRDIEVIADYLLAKVIGRGPVTREECFETLGERVRSCSELPGAQ